MYPTHIKISNHNLQITVTKLRDFSVISSEERNLVIK